MTFNLVHWQASQIKWEDLENDNSKLKLEIICFKIRKVRWSSLWCHLDEVVLTFENVTNGENLIQKLKNWY